MRLMVIGLDGATWRTLDPWMAAGLLPTLEGLLARGARAVLRSTVPPVTAPAWVSCFTGVNPGVHGIYNFVRTGPGWGQVTPHSGRDVRVPRLWQRLNHLGYSTHVLDVPLTFPPEPVHGVMVSDLMVSGERGARTSPPAIFDELRRELGASFQWAVADRLEVSAAYLRHLARTLEEKVRLDHYLLTRHPVDAAFTVYQQTDVLHHYFWHLWDEGHPAHDPARTLELEPWLRAVLRRIDRALARLLTLAGEDALIAIVSDHGFGPAGLRVHVNDLLLAWGDLVIDPDAEDRLEWRRRGLTPSRLIQVARHLDRWSIRRYLRLDTARRALALVESAGPAPSLERSRAWFAHGLSPGITLSPAVRRDELYIAALMDRLREARPAPDRPRYFERVERREEVFHGPAVEEAPEIVVQLAEGYVATTELTGGPGFSAPLPGQVSGFHRPEGVLVLAGPGIRAGQVLPEASILDITPTLLAGLGLTVAPEIEGRVLVEAFEQGLIDPEQLRSGPSGGLETGGHVREAPVFDAGEEAQILRRLRALGYQ